MSLERDRAQTAMDTAERHRCVAHLEHLAGGQPGAGAGRPIDKPFRIYCDAGVVLTHKGSAQPKAKTFVEFLQSPAGRKIFSKRGWDAR